MTSPHSAGPGQGAARGVVAGIDFGTVRIGVALSDVERRMAMPLETYTRRAEAADARHFRQLVQTWRVTLFVVGLPVFASGDESEKSMQARKFGEWLARTTGIPVCYYDERYTTAQAEAMLEAADLTSKQRKARRDKLAAQILLAGFLESGRSADGPYTPGPLEG